MKTSHMFRSALIASGVLLALACSEQSPVAVNATGPSLDLAGAVVKNPQILSCSTLPYDSVTVTIGKEGGTILVGPHTLVIPKSAIDHDVEITAVAPVSDVRFVRFKPEGLKFKGPVKLTLNYDNCGALGALSPKKVVYTDDFFSILATQPSKDHAKDNTVDANLTHFSGYAVAF